MVLVFWRSARRKPTSAERFAVDVAGCAVDGDFHLWSVHAALRGFAFVLRANLHAGVEFVVHFDFEFQFEIAVFLGGAEKGVGAALDRFADDAAVFDAIFALAHAGALPTFEAFAVEELDETAFLRADRGERTCESKQCWDGDE